MSNKVIKSVSLNVTNADDAAILKAVKRRNFSGYVKSLILADIRARENAAAAQEGDAHTPSVMGAGERLEVLKRKISGQAPAQPKPFLSNQGINR